MSQEKVNLGLPLTDSTSSVDEGLRVLARMIARRLRAIKADVGEQHPHPSPPLGGVSEKAGSQSPETSDGKQAVPPFNYKRLDIPDALTKEGGSDG